MDFGLTEKQLQLQKHAREFAERYIRPVAAHYDEADVFPWEVLKQAAEAGLYGPRLYELHEQDPSGLPLILVGEELAWGCGGIALAILSTGLPYFALKAAGTDDQVAEWAPQLFGISTDPTVGAFAVTEPLAGSDVSSIATTAVRRGADWVLNGRKSFITNGGIADVHLVAATVQPGSGHRGQALFVVPAATPGLTWGNRDPKMGVRASHTAGLALQDVRVPSRNLVGGETALQARLAGETSSDSHGGSGILRALEITRPHVAAQAVGVARAALEFVTAYAAQRQQFGRPIIEHQAIGSLLAAMEVEVEAARLLTYRAGWVAASGRGARTSDASKAKLKAGETAVGVTEKAVQVMGGYGYIKDYPVEKWYRDAKIYTLFEGTSQIQELLIARSLARRNP